MLNEDIECYNTSYMNYDIKFSINEIEDKLSFLITDVAYTPKKYYAFDFDTDYIFNNFDLIDDLDGAYNKFKSCLFSQNFKIIHNSNGSLKLILYNIKNDCNSITNNIYININLISKNQYKENIQSSNKKVKDSQLSHITTSMFVGIENLEAPKSCAESKLYLDSSLENSKIAKTILLDDAQNNENKPNSNINNNSSFENNIFVDPNIYKTILVDDVKNDNNNSGIQNDSFSLLNSKRKNDSVVKNKKYEDIKSTCKDTIDNKTSFCLLKDSKQNINEKGDSIIIDVAQPQEKKKKKRSRWFFGNICCIQ